MKNIEDRIAELEKKIADIKKRWPAHSVNITQVQELEDLESELKELRNQLN